MSNSQKIVNLSELLKIKIEDKDSLQKDFESILNMFDDIKDIQVESISDQLSKKVISLSDLREDTSKVFKDFSPKFKGNYIKVPAVSKK